MKALTSRRALVIVSVAVGVLVVALGIVRYVSASTPLRYRTAAASRGTVSQTLSLTGTLQPANITNVDFQVSGQVAEVDAQAGQQINAGDTLAKLNTSQLQTSLTQAEATLTSAESKLSLDQSTAHVAQATLNGDNAQISSAQAAVNQAQDNLNDAVLTSPVSGTVLQVNISAGQGSSASGGGNGSQSGGGGAAGSSGTASSSGSGSAHGFVIMTAGPYNVIGEVSDSQIDQVASGQMASVTPSGATQALVGKVTAIAPQATVTSGVATFLVTVRIDNPPSSFRPGASAQVDIVVNRVVDVLMVPTSAVHTTSAGSTVDVLSNSKPQSVPVQLGAADASNTQIVSGLNAGQQVVIATITSQVPVTNAGGGFFGGGLGGARRGGAGGGAGAGGGG